MRHIEINVPDLMISVPNDQHFFWRLDEVVESLADVVSRNPGWPAAGFSQIHGLAARHFIVGPFEALFGEICEIRIVEVSHAKSRWSSRSPLEITDAGMGRIVPNRREFAWDCIEIRSDRSPAEIRAREFRDIGLWRLLCRCGFDDCHARHERQGDRQILSYHGADSRS